MFVLLINVPSFIGRWYLEIASYTTGTKLVQKMDESGLITLISKAAGIIGLTMVGAMVASNVSLSTPLTLNFGDVPFELQSAFDMIMPGFLPLMLSLLVIAAAAQKRQSQLDYHRDDGRRHCGTVYRDLVERCGSS